jgi:hypothetical protein
MGYVPLYYRMGENDEMGERNGQLIKSHHLPEGIRGKNINISVYLIYEMRFEHGTSKIQRSKCNHYVISFGLSWSKPIHSVNAETIFLACIAPSFTLKGS